MSEVDEIKVGKATIRLTQGDITKQETDVIVNAANSSLTGGGGVDGAIHRAGGPAILEECRKIIAGIGRLPTGKAIITSGGNLKARHVIHTVGPVWHGGNHGEAELLASAYNESLKLASERKLKSVAFPSISTGAYGYPIDAAAQIAVVTVTSFLQNESTSLEQVVFVLYDAGSYRAYAARLNEINR